jgi:hypothetical protein
MNWVVYRTLCGSSYVYESGQDLPEMCPLCSSRERKEGKKLGSIVMMLLAAKGTAVVVE